MDKLIGKSFKRNKYGLTTWTKQVNLVAYDYSTTIVEGIYVQKIKIKVSEEIKSPYLWYDLDEIVFIGDKIDKMGEILNRFAKCKIKSK